MLLYIIRTPGTGLHIYCIVCYTAHFTRCSFIYNGNKPQSEPSTSEIQLWCHSQLERSYEMLFIQRHSEPSSVSDHSGILYVDTSLPSPKKPVKAVLKCTALNCSSLKYLCPSTFRFQRLFYPVATVAWYPSPHYPNHPLTHTYTVSTQTTSHWPWMKCILLYQ